jgi:hypothetical protein
MTDVLRMKKTIPNHLKVIAGGAATRPAEKARVAKKRSWTDYTIALAEISRDEIDEKLAAAETRAGRISR